jgi:RND family efflux transporter MFP subunit
MKNINILNRPCVGLLSFAMSLTSTVTKGFAHAALTAICLLIFTVAAPAFAEDSHGHDAQKEQAKEAHDASGGDHDDDDEAGASVALSPESMKEAGIVVQPLRLQSLEGEITAPGEVKLNSYLSSKVTPRITAQVVKRHAKLGDEVKKGQPLLTLSSVEVAEAVGELLGAHKEWRRVKQLGSSAVSAKRYSRAKIANMQAKAKVMAYGMTKAQVEKLYAKGASPAPGEFQLTAQQDGVIVSDDFIEGELIEPGRILFNIVNEDVLWVESRLSPKQAESVESDALARVLVPGNGWLQGKVIQKHHMLDEATRTIGIRIEVNNKADKLHPGMFVDTKIQTGKGNQYLAVPTRAVLRSPDGDWVVFIEQEKPGEFKPEEVELVKVIDDYTVIKGVPEGTRIVTAGAFFVQSELAKSGFSVHNH